ncbi:MAG: Gfo/Idh/MocA family oxidoreductase [Spirochaetales bacterium]|nr:Gfo/Idh/MocA family oxidoreductase [Spirochaetales bacterium]MBQ5364840.1 Gfo/Idh/MocA family oxidoreductase [Spirochaetales bacterium]
MALKRYAQVGTGGRARMYYEAVASKYSDIACMVGFCDQSQTRMNYANSRLEELGAKKVPTYLPHEFEKMIAETKPDIVIVTSVDRTHDDYICRAMEAGCDVITEKPLTIDERKAQRIIDTQKKTGRHVRVTFNYRYAPYHTKVRELIRDGAIGTPTSVHFEWLLNTEHGADYYRRWHRNKVNSGGLLVHKATHHFDLVNFWLGTDPESVFGFGSLQFYGRAAAEKRGVEKFYYRCHGSEEAKGDPFAIDLESNPTLKALYLDAEADSGYIRDRSVFSDDISIEDTMNLVVRYKNGVQMSYSLTSYMPWEGFNVMINGTKGRLEYHSVERPYINAGGDKKDEGALKYSNIRVYPMFGDPYDVSVKTGEGGHGGGDPVLLDDIFLENPPYDEFHRAADFHDGVKSILVGIAGNKSIASGQMVNIDSLIHW